MSHLADFINVIIVWKNSVRPCLQCNLSKEFMYHIVCPLINGLISLMTAFRSSALDNNLLSERYFNLNPNRVGFL